MVFKMNIAFPILLLALGGLTFWLLTESKLKWYFKAASITTFCAFTILFWGTIHSYLGWPANAEDMPDKALIHWVVIKEPSKLTDYEGGIYLLIESVEESDNFVLRFFGYKKEDIEPRLFGLPYSRELHEQIQKELMPQLKTGKPVMGSLKKKGEGKSKKKKGDSDGRKKGGGSESQKQDWEFHKLRPSDFQEKPE